MSIVKMKRLRMFALSSDRDDIFVKLQRYGCVEISDQSDKLTDPEWNRLVRPMGSDLKADKAMWDKMIGALEALDKFAPVKSGFLSAKPAYNQTELYDESAFNKAREVSEEILGQNGRINAAFAKINKYLATRATIAPWEKVEIPLETTGTGFTKVRFGVCPATVSFPDMEQAVSDAADAAQIFEVGRDAEQVYIVLICHRAQEEDALQAVKNFGFGSAAFKGVSGTAAENLAEIDGEIAALEAEKASAIAEIASYNAHRLTLKLCSDRLLSDLSREESKERLLSTDKVFFLEGWVPTPDLDGLETILGEYTSSWELEDPVEEEYEKVPIKLKGNNLTSPFTMITEMYSLPAYNGVDPNALIMPFFTIFFGIMFADVGYGLVLLVLGIILSAKMKPRGTMKYMCGLLKICGISAMVFGAITGTFFGDAIEVVAKMYGGNVTVPRLINTLEDPMTVLVVSLVLGGIQLMAGLAVQAYMLIRDGHWVDALCDIGTLYLTFAGLALGALGITWIVCIVGVVSIVATQGRSSKSIGGKIGGGVWALYNTVTGYFGDVLSYCRLMALMLASSVIASVFNTLGSMGGSIIVFFVIFVVGHVLNMGLSIISSFVHTARLQYLEFFSKFYRDGGKPFEPLAVSTNYVDII